MVITYSSNGSLKAKFERLDGALYERLPFSAVKATDRLSCFDFHGSRCDLTYLWRVLFIRGLCQQIGT